LLNPKDISILEKLNLSGDNLYDFYLFSIFLLKKVFKKYVNGSSWTADCREYAVLIFDYFIDRNVVKKPLMTANYGVSIRTS
jgi:hypothetical protein